MEGGGEEEPRGINRRLKFDLQQKVRRHLDVERTNSKCRLDSVGTLAVRISQEACQRVCV